MIIVVVVTLQQSFKKNGSTMLFFFFLAYNLGMLFSVSCCRYHYHPQVFSIVIIVISLVFLMHIQNTISTMHSFNYNYIQNIFVGVPHSWNSKLIGILQQSIVLFTGINLFVFFRCYFPWHERCSPPISCQQIQYSNNTTLICSTNI